MKHIRREKWRREQKLVRLANTRKNGEHAIVAGRPMSVRGSAGA